LIWPGWRRKRDDDPEFVSEPLRLHWIWKLLAIALPFGLGTALVAAAILGAKTVDHTSRAGATGTVARMSGAGAAAGGRRVAFVVPAWLGWAALAMVLVAIASAGLRMVLARAQPVEQSAQQSAARAAVKAALAALDAPDDPRSAVIAAYAAMERTLAAHGVARLRAEAPREYLRRVLVATSGAEREASALTGMFEEARFSTHPIPERLRQLALAALTSLCARLVVRGRR